ncbi:MAG: Z1 domain-containing protein [Prevotellaceae bacterium]|nr:Z1 domain-containing protein [Candidatus Faecinaster equi]
MSYTDIEYDQVRTWIKTKREHPTKPASWESLMFACKNDESGLLDFLSNRADEDYWPELSVADWQAIVLQQKSAEEETIRLDRENGSAIINGSNQINNLSIPQGKNSSWQSYKRGLSENGFKQTTIDTIERSTIKILRRLSKDTTNSNPIKGMVIGNVQSGKTANMAALMAMAADWGWNMFIILSGTIDNLRKQTEGRLFNDLHRADSVIDWQALDHPRSNMPNILKAKSLNFDKRNYSYFTVCLKNKARLKELILWMQEDRHVQAQMKVLVIDDEADQAGINTADVDSNERKAINGLIRNLVNGKAWDSQNCSGHYQAMNYIGYTATPYANILNEAGSDSLYPKDFISTLSVSKEYFGPQQIFGCEDSGYDGLSIVRTIPIEEVEHFKKLHKYANQSIPDTLMDAVCWFLCGVACMRYWNYKKPISMLIHTSQNTNHHANVADALMVWLNSLTTDQFITKCKRVWLQETSTFSLQDFLDQYADYGLPAEEIIDYPDFSKIEGEIRVILDGTRVSHIEIAEQKKPRYHNGIHLCVDNCKNNGIDNDMLVRLVYPEKDAMPSPAPAFIVIGGATLSRGLTIEGLISTYFLRSVKQSDTLMQMGRWFGYRRGYELIPRIWLTSNTEKQFEFLSLLDQRLRDEIHHMETFGISPSNYGPRVTNSPRMSFIRIVAKNRMQKAQDTDKDYSGAASQTFMFDNDLSILKRNLKNTKDFLCSLPDPDPIKACNTHSKNCLIWRGVALEDIARYLRNYTFQSRQSVFDDLETMLDWLQKMTDEGSIGEWNIVLAGINKENTTNGFWEVKDGKGVYKVTRTQITKNKQDNILNIKALRVPKDIIADIDLENITDPIVIERVKHFSSKYANETRELAGLSKVPQLLIYIVDKDSKHTKPSNDRCDLNAKDDVVGLSLTIPGENKYKDHTATVSVLIDEIGINDEETDINDAD